MSLKINVPHTLVDGPKAPRCDVSTDEEFAESSDDNFIASDNEETFTEADPTKLTKEGAAFVMGTHHAVNTYDKWHPTSEQDKALKIKILDTLKDNTTYSFNFGNSILDNNEGNLY